MIDTYLAVIPSVAATLYLSPLSKIKLLSSPGDDSDAFADDEALSSDGMEEKDDISTVSILGEDCDYLTEPIYSVSAPLVHRRWSGLRTIFYFHMY